MNEGLKRNPVVVIGAGMVGVSTAIWLQRSGRDVILMDKGAPGMGASFGNAGLIAQWGVAPVTSPTLWREAPPMLLNPRSALFVKWGHILKMAPWLVQFMSHATHDETRRIVHDMAALIGDAVDQHKSLVAGTSVDAWIRDSRISYVYRDKKAFDADAYTWGLKAEVGFKPALLTGPAVQEAEPMLGPAAGCLAVLAGQGHITNPGAYIAALVGHFQSQGGRFIQTEVRDLVRKNGKVTQVLTTDSSIDCDKVIVTAGIWSKDLMRKLGLKVPIETERGYHVIFENPSQLPHHPMLVMDGKFGVNPMETGLRCAGTVELGDHHAGPSQAPLKLLYRQAKAIFPHLTYSGTQEWMGFRPTTADSLPLIGEIGESGIYAGFGHQHVGLTAGPKTGRLIAQMIDGTPPNLDMTPYEPARFGVR